MTSGPVDGFINKYINIYLYICIYIQVYLYLPTCVIGGLSELKPENCPPGGGGANRGIIYVVYFGANRGILKHSTPEYPSQQGFSPLSAMVVNHILKGF